MSNQMRDEFEEWAAEEAEVRGVGTLLGLMKDEHHDRYSMIWTQTAWVAWQASRESLVIELPGACECCHDQSAIDMNEACAQVIEAAGLKVKA